jgi:tellurite resistance protein
MLGVMTPSEKNVLKSLVVVAWADGKVARPEASVIEGLLSAFDANEAEEREILEFSRRKRTLSEDIPWGELGDEDRELLLANAALLTHADGEQSASEKDLIDKLIGLLGFTSEQAEPILESVRDGALVLGTKPLTPVD